MVTGLCFFSVVFLNCPGATCTASSQNASAALELERLRWLSGRASLVSPSARLKLQLSRLEGLEQRLGRSWRQAMSSRREKLLPLIRTLQAVSPLATLERGYAIVSLESGDILRDAADAKPGTLIEARLSRGRVRARVEGAS